MASLRRRKKETVTVLRTPTTSEEPAGEEPSPFPWELEEKWAEAWRQARRADLR